jgi:PKHD-type hydroxylase
MSWYLDIKKSDFWAYAERAFTSEECDLVIELGKELNLANAKINVDLSTNLVNNDIRKGNVGFFDPNEKSTEWIFRKITDYVSEINKRFWNYDLHYIETLQFTSYKNVGDFYEKHVDQLSSSIHYRKLSFSVQLSDPDSYEGADLLMHFKPDGNPVNKKKGDIVFFPSHVLHEVTPLVRGERYSLVGWVCGPSFR